MTGQTMSTQTRRAGNNIYAAGEEGGGTIGQMKHH